MCSFQTVLWVEKKVQQPAGRFLKHLMLFSEGFGSVTVAGCTRCWRSWAVPCLFILTIKVQCLLCVIDVYTWCLPPMRSGEGRAQLGSYWSVETSCKVTSVKCFTCRAACGAKICCSFAWLGLSSEKLMLSRRILRRLPDVNVIEFFILYFEPLLNVSLGKVLKKTEQKNEMGSDKELAAIQLWICVGRPKMCSVSYRKERNNKAWPLPLSYGGRRVSTPCQLWYSFSFKWWISNLFWKFRREGCSGGNWQVAVSLRAAEVPNPSKPPDHLLKGPQNSSHEGLVQLSSITTCVKPWQRFSSGIAFTKSCHWDEVHSKYINSGGFLWRQRTPLIVSQSLPHRTQSLWN